MANTPLLGLTLPVTGTLSGTWGDVINNEISSLIDSAIAGTTTLSTDADVTLTTTVSATNEAREAILLCTGARTVLRTITAPAQSKVYVIINATTGGQSVKLVGAGPTTGVTVLNGTQVIVAWNGSDFVSLGSVGVTSFSAGTTGLTPASVTTGAIVLAGTLAVLNGGTGVTTSTGSGNNVLSTSPTLVTPVLGTPSSVTLTNATGLPLTSGVTGTLPVANGGTGVTTSTGTGATVRATSPTLVTPALGTPSALVGTSITGTATAFTVGALNGYSTATNPTTGQTLFPTKTGTTTYTLQTTTLSTSAPSGGVAGDVWYRYA